MTIDKLHVAKAPGSQEVRYWNLVNTSASHFKGDDSKAFKVGASEVINIEGARQTIRTFTYLAHYMTYPFGGRPEAAAKVPPGPAIKKNKRRYTRTQTNSYM